MRKTIVVPAPSLKSYKQDLLKDTPEILGLSVRVFDFAFNEGNIDRIKMKVSAYEALKNVPLERIHDTVMHPKTLDAFLDFIVELNALGIPLSALPQSTPLQKEIFESLHIMSQCVQELKINPNTKYQVYPHGLSFSQHEFLKAHNIEILPFTIQQAQSITFNTTLNARFEIEAVVQDILTKNIQNATILIPHFESKKPLIESVFARYGLALSLQDRDFKLTQQKFLSLLDYGMSPNRDNLDRILEINALNLKNHATILKYIHHFEIDMERFFLPFDYVQEQGDASLLQQQSRIQEDVLIAQEALSSLSKLPYHKLLQTVYEHLESYKPSGLKLIKNFLEEHALRFSSETHAILKASITSLSQSKQTDNGIHVDDISNLPLVPVEHLYVLDLSAKNFPQVKSHTGLLDETYRAQIHGYPNQDKRINYELELQNKVLYSAHNLTLSYHIADYEGKSQECSYAIHQFAQEHDIKLKTWPLQQISERTPIHQHLDSVLAQSLYLNNGNLSGSISRFQNYVEDPYQYFVESGLACYEPRPLGMNPMTFGTLNHAILERKLAKEKENEWDKLYFSFPKHSPKLAMIQKRNNTLMERAYEHLCDALLDTDFEVAETEHVFKNVAMFPNIALNGIIDRIDTHGQDALIIDYKTTPTTLSKEQIITGAQLQLLTYARYIKMYHNKNIVGVFNYGLSHGPIPFTKYQYSASKGIQELELDVEKESLNQRRFSGWFFTDDVHSFHSDNYFKGLNTVKGDILKLSRKPYRFDLVELVLDTLYRDISTHILQGVLDPKDIKLTDFKDINFQEEKEGESDGL